MATFLVTPRMNPALRARVERAVSGKARARQNAAALGLKGTPFAGGGKGPRFMRLLPLVALLIVGGLVTAAVMTEKREREADEGQGHERNSHRRRLAIENGKIEARDIAWCAPTGQGEARNRTFPLTAAGAYPDPTRALRRERTWPKRLIRRLGP